MIKMTIAQYLCEALSLYVFVDALFIRCGCTYADKSLLCCACAMPPCTMSLHYTPCRLHTCSLCITSLYAAAQHSACLPCCQTAETMSTVPHAMFLVLDPNAKVQALFAAVSQARCVCSMLSSQIALTDWQRHAGPMRNWRLFQDFRLKLVQTFKIPILTPALMAAMRLSLVT